MLLAVEGGGECTGYCEVQLGYWIFGVNEWVFPFCTNVRYKKCAKTRLKRLTLMVMFGQVQGILLERGQERGGSLLM